MEEDFIKMSDDELIAITTTSNNNQHLQDAAVELHRRKKEIENKNFLLQNKNISLQKWILGLTIVILILTAVTVIFAFLSYKPLNVNPHKDSTQPQQENYNQQHRVLKPMNEVIK